MLDPLLITAAAAAAVWPFGTAAPDLNGAERGRPKQMVRLTPEQMFKLAEQAKQRGDTSTAAALLTALARNPDADIRAEALFRRAKQLIGEKQPSEAAALLRRILDDKPDATGVRLHLAQLLQELGDPDGALRQLRSAQAAGLPPEVVRLVDRYSQAIRATRPFGMSFEVAVAPDSNINRATRSDTLGTVVGEFEIDEESKAKSGTGLSLRGHAYRRFATPIGSTTVLARLSGSSDLYRQKDFNDIAVDLAAGPELRLGSNRIAVEAGLTQRWFGQEPFIRAARLSASWSRPLGTRTQARLSSTVSLVDNRLNDLQDGKTYSGKLEVERALSATTGIAANLSFDRQALNDPGYSTSARRVGLLGWRDLGRATVTLGANFSRLKADERLLLFPSKRSDRYSSFSIGATFRQLGFGGFAPTARLTVERNRSTLEFHDYSRTRTEFGLVRAF